MVLRKSQRCSAGGRHCQSNYCSKAENINGQTTEGCCHIDFKHNTHRLAHMKRKGHTASKVVEDVDLSYLTLTALTLKKMKRNREEGQRKRIRHSSG